MVEREESRRVIALLDRIDAPLFRAAGCWFGGGSAVSLRCEEFRVSRDVDFLCASRDGYRLLRERVHRDGAQGVRGDGRDGVRARGHRGAAPLAPSRRRAVARVASGAEMEIIEVGAVFVDATSLEAL